ncbi:lipoprotein-releasing system permease protein [Stella humosa]|uniref:Lipoprotein-releasing system permease protein n=1 Tax=Stella humosa TaxID=94 RepID=A0A3N1MG03_9PROT|nr:lipoprotein-releasing ABC transporter permease subunit [Stella humosa]ROQ01667.1 lipoprotein-releasing system permease protein [Stella humosa]BBK32049.1 LolC/E family lipoprotein releasing system, protein [Stella humosa]
MIFSAFERMLAFRYLRSRRQEGFISVIAGFSFLGIALGVATLIIVMSVMNGFRQELLGRILGLNGHMTVLSTQGNLRDFDRVADAVRRIPGVVTATPQIEGQVMASNQGRASGAIVRGVRPDDLKARKLIAEKIEAGFLNQFGGEDTVVIGYRLAQKLGLLIGDRLTLISPQGVPSPMGTLPRIRSYKIVAVFNVGMFEYDSSHVFLPLEAAQLFFQMPDAATGIEVFATDADQVRRLRQDILAAAGPGVRVYDWQQANSSFFNALQVERNVMFLILTLIIVVAAFNIISSMIMLVKDKGRDIAILRTMGATRGMVLRIFFLTGASIGIVGTLAGFGLGLAFCQNIESIRQALQALTGTPLFSPEVYFLSRLPAIIDWREVSQVLGMGLALSFFATIYPAWRAARLDPVEALRYE